MVALGMGLSERVSGLQHLSSANVRALGIELLSHLPPVE
jgi:hypothetical protein